MDAVSTSATAMDAVSTSATAMDAVSASTMATTVALLSDFFGRIFSKQTGSERFFNGRTINPNSGKLEGITYGYTWQNGSNNDTYGVEFSSDTPAEFDGGRSLTIDSSVDVDGNSVSGFENSDEAYSEYVLDVSDASNFNVYLKDPDGNQFCIFIAGTKVAAGLTPGSWEKNTFDVSGESGEVTIGIGSNNNATGGQWSFTSPHLE